MNPMETFFQAMKFYHDEALMLDHRKFSEWLELFEDDLEYRMPVRITKERREGSDVNDEMTYFEETKTTLAKRVKRLGTTSAWAEDPAPRTRHMITNVVIESENEQELTVRTYFLFLRSRAEEIEVEQLFGERLDILRKKENSFKIQSRTIYPDQAVLSVKNLSMFL